MQDDGAINLTTPASKSAKLKCPRGESSSPILGDTKSSQVYEA